MASNIQVALSLATTKALTTLNLATNPVTTIGDSQYVPVTIDLTQSDILAPVIAIASQSKLKTETVGAFDKVRVGDFVRALENGTLTAKATGGAEGVFLAAGLKEITYDAGNNSTNLGIKSGDTITVESSGTGIPADTTVTKIDYTNRKIYIDKALTETKIANVVTQPPIRVTAVRKSTATDNPNEIDIDSTVATTGTLGQVLIQGGAVDGVFTVLRLTPIDNTVNSKATLSISAATLDGSQVKGSVEGFNGLAYDTLTYSNIGQYQTDLDTYRTKAGVAAPTS